MLIGTLEQSFIFAIMVLGVYISYKVLDFPDMTVDGSFPMGGAITAALLVKGVDPILALVVAMIGGAAAGFVTGIIHVKLKISNLLAGIIVMTGLYSVNLRIMGKSNIPLFGVRHLFNLGTSSQSKLFQDIIAGSKYSSLVIIIICLLIVKSMMDFLLKTKFGFSLKALGDNESLVVGLGLDEKKLKVIGLMLSDSLVALAGGILAQYQGFSDVGMGTGTIVTGLASIIIGDALFTGESIPTKVMVWIRNKLLFWTKHKKTLNVTSIAIIGTVLYRLIISVALKIGMNPSDLKLITSILVIVIIFLKELNSGHKIKGEDK